MTKKKVLTLKHGRGVVHQLDCPWLNGPKAAEYRERYEIVSVDTVQGKRHCRVC